jgi:hypothetical protein
LVVRSLSNEPFATPKVSQPMFRSVTAVASLLALFTALAARGQEIRLVERKPDPYGSPRPANGAAHVPLRTSICFDLELYQAKASDRILPDSVTLDLQAEGGEVVHLLLANRRFAEGARGWLRRRSSPGDGWTVYVDPGIVLQPGTRYTARAAGRSRDGLNISPQSGTWSFTTEAGTERGPVAEENAVDFALDLGTKPVHWHGGFFTGICNVVFCTRAETFGPLYRMMRDAHGQHPRAWRYQRDIWLTATDDRKPDWHLLMDPLVPNLMRERQTRRVTAIEGQAGGVLLHLEDFFGHEQYGVAAGRPLSEDYRPSYEVLVADGVSNARSKVLAVDDAAGTILVAPIPTPEPGWRLDYQAPPPKKESPDAPGLFAAGGTHLRRFDPPGTPVYFWGRLDKEWDLAHMAGGRRLVVDFVEAPSDLSLTGRPYTGPKDYAVWHEAVRTVAGHLIDRYGDDSLDFAWSVFNEPDLVGDYWRFHWDEVQRFYDYTVDAVLRAFEDRGYDSGRVKVGGWELGAIFGPHLRLKEILAHCSPLAEAEGALEENAAVADPRLDGRRSRRVEDLCRAHGGKGSPCDFISIHAYNRSEMTAAKLTRAKEMALEADAEFYRELWIDCHESCPDWSPPPDEAAADSYLGNGYFPTWCLDVAHRLLQQAAADPRYAYGESVVTIWPPPSGFAGINTLAGLLPVDDDGDGLSDRTVTVPTPIFHALSLLSDLGPDYWVLSPQQIGGHTLGGFASRDPEGVVRVALYSHHAGDIQSRSDRAFKVTLNLTGVDGADPIRVTEYRFDREHNTYFSQAVALRDGPMTGADPEEVESLTRILEEGDPAALRQAFKRIQRLDAGSLHAIAPAFLQMAAGLTDPELREAAQAVMRAAFAPAASSQPGYPREKVEEIQKLAELRPTAVTTPSRKPGGGLQLEVRLSGNGANMLLIEQKGG